jgi:hypothetical protein
VCGRQGRTRYDRPHMAARSQSLGDGLKAMFWYVVIRDFFVWSSEMIAHLTKDNGFQETTAFSKLGHHVLQVYIRRMNFHKSIRWLRYYECHFTWATPFNRVCHFLLFLFNCSLVTYPLSLICQNITNCLFKKNYIFLVFFCK